MYDNVSWGLKFIIYFDLFSKGLFQSYNESHIFDMLNHVVFFCFFSIRSSLSYDPGHEFDRLTWVIFYVFLFFYFILQHWTD
jgi:hypothetical protein